MDGSDGMILVAESSEANEDHLPLETLRRFGLTVQVVHTSREAMTAVRLNKPIVVFLANKLDDGLKGTEVQAAIRAVRAAYRPSLIALDPEIEPTKAEWRLNRQHLNLEAKLYGLMKSVLMARGFSQVLVVEDPRAAEKIAERVFAPNSCVRIGTYHTAGLALEGAWRHQPAIIVLDESLGAGSTGADFLLGLAGLRDYTPIVIGLSESLRPELALALGQEPALTAGRGSDFETRLRSTLREAHSRLGQKALDANA